MSRQTDALSPSVARRLAASSPVSAVLPAIDWASIGHSAPKPVAVPKRAPADPLPKADVVIITWTNAEWSALDHVFVNSSTTRGSDEQSGAWSKDWLPYTRAVGSFTSDLRSEPLWGYFRLVSMTGVSKALTVLLFHSNAHLQYQPYIGGLRAMVGDIIADTKPEQLYSIGTAGGANLDQALGDAVVTDGATLLPGVPPNDTDPANGKTFTCAAWYPSSSLFVKAQSLMFPLSQVVTQSELNSLFEKLREQTSVGSVSLSDLINSPLDPQNLAKPTTHSMKGIPLNTSCNYGMAPGAGTTAFSAYEEDDAAVGQAAAGVNFAFIRNVSDSVVPDQTAAGVAIPADLRKSWAGILYDRFGWITASNGALATWAAVAAS